MVAVLDNLSNRSRDDHDFYTVINFGIAQKYSPDVDLKKFMHE